MGSEGLGERQLTQAHSTLPFKPPQAISSVRGELAGQAGTQEEACFWLQGAPLHGLLRNRGSEAWEAQNILSRPPEWASPAAELLG